MPETWIALQAVGFRASIENGKTRSWRFVATAITPTGHSDRPMIPPKIDGRVPWMSTWMKPGNPAYRPLTAGMWTVTTSLGSASSKPLIWAIRRAVGFRLDRISEDVAARQPEAAASGAFCSVSALGEHHADVEGRGGDDHQGDDPAGEQNEDLATLSRPRRSGTASC